MNKVILIGNLTRDPELKETPSGVAVCQFSLAVTRDYTNSEGNRETDFFDCTAWRGLGETVSKYCKKGNKLLVVGSIQFRSYEDNDGIRRHATDVIVKEIEFLTPKSSDGFDDGFDAPRASAAPAKKKPVLQAMEGDDDIPF